MIFFDFLQSWLGGGTIVALISSFLLYKSSKKGRDIDWYDRAIQQVKELDAKIDELEGIIEKLNGSLKHEKQEKEQLKNVVKQMEFIISGLKGQLEEYKKTRGVDYEEKI